MYKIFASKRKKNQLKGCREEGPSTTSEGLKIESSLQSRKDYACPGKVKMLPRRER
jgi:hypothetical protein